MRRINIISDDEALGLAEVLYSLILKGVCFPDEMVRRRLDIYWGDRGFLEEYYHRQPHALKYLEKKGRVRSENIIYEVNGVEVKRIAYYIDSIS